MKRRRIAVVGILLLAIVIAVPVAIKRMAPPHRLLDRSVRVASCDGWWVDEDQYGMCVQWLSDQKLLYAATKPDNTNLAAFFTLDARTGTRSSLESLTAAFDRYPGSPVFLRVSPDGSRALWQSEEWTVVEAIAGGKPLLWNTKHGSAFANIAWMADGRRWVDFVNDGMSGTGMPSRLMIYDVTSPSTVETAPFLQEIRLEDLLGIQNTTGDLIMMTSDDVVDEVGSKERHISDYRVGKSVAKARDISCFGACDTGRQLAALSPDGGKIAWLEIHKKDAVMQENWFSRLYRRLFQVEVTPFTSRLEMHVSDLDGGSPMILGGIDTDVERIFDTKMRCLTWLPGGKKISYVYDNVLYTIEAP